MTSGWPITRWIVALSLISLLLATLVSASVISWFPRPAPSPMSVEQAARIVEGQLSPDAAGLRMRMQPAPPAGDEVDWLSRVAARRLGLAVERVRVVGQSPGPTPTLHVIDAGSAVAATARDAVLEANERALAGLPMPAFVLGVQQADGQWRVVERGNADVVVWQRRVLVALAVSALLLAPIVAWAAVRVGRPLRRLVQATASLTLDRAEPLATTGPREVRLLADAINTGQQRMRAQAQELTHTLAAVAHDLRTPLTGLRIRAEFAPPQHAQRMVADIERMSAMIDQVLDFSRGQLQEPALAETDIRRLLEDCVHAASLRGSAVALQCPAPLRWRVDALLLRRALDNLVDNAQRYASDIGLVALTRDGALLLEVTDRGPGISGQERDRLLQPFQRGDASRNRETGGAGLGLAVAAGVAAAHGGTLELHDRDGGGLCVRLVLPRLHVH